MNVFSAAEQPFTHLEEKEIESRQVFRGRLLDVRCDRAMTPDGHEVTREFIRHQGAAVVIPWLDDRCLLMERQFRYPLQRPFVEFPAGKIDQGEAPFTTAQRELLEETGYQAEDWRHLGTMHPSIGYSDERIEIFSAKGLTAGDRCLDHGEHLDLIEVSLEDALQAVRDGHITDAKTIVGLMWAEKMADDGW